MKEIALFLLTLSVSITVRAQNENERRLESEVEQVTVYLQGAQVFRSAEVSLPAGSQKLIFPNLSPYLIEKSIQVKVEGAAVLLSVNHRLNYLEEMLKSQRLDSLQRVKDALDSLNEEAQVRLDVLDEKVEVLQKNRRLDSSSNLDQLKASLSFYETAMSDIKSEQLIIRRAIEERDMRLEKLNKQEKGIREFDDKGRSEVEIQLRVEKQSVVRFALSYLVDQAGWFPRYDVRVTDVSQPFQLDYIAEVLQRTGEDWEAVRLLFSTTNPSQSGQAPELDRWNLNLARNTRLSPSAGTPFLNANEVQGQITDESGEPLIGATVLVKGTSIGTSTDLYGRYTLTLPPGAEELVVNYIGYNSQTVPISSSQLNVSLAQKLVLSEVVVVGSGARKEKGRAGSKPSPGVPQTTLTKNELDMTFEVEEPYTLHSRNETRRVPIRQYKVPASYAYRAVPKLEPAAFITARFTDWDQYGLLPGEANLYFEESYVGRAVLNAQALSDTLDLSMGRDRNIAIEREVVDEYTRRQSLGGHQLESRGIRIRVRNNKNQPVQLQVQDQIPVPVINDIKVEAENLGGGQLNEETGEIFWNLVLDPQEQRDLFWEYEVKFPKGESVILD